MPDNILVRDATGAALNMRTSEVGGVHTPVHRMEGYDPVDDMVKVKSVQKKMRDSFAGPLVEQWDISEGLGSTSAVVGGVMTMTTGTTAGGFTEILSKEFFTVPFRAMVGIQTGTRVTNTHNIVEAVSIDPITLQPDGKNSAYIDVGGMASTTVTQMKYGVQSSAMRALESAVSTIVSTSTYSILDIETFMDETFFHSRAMDSTAGRSNSYCRHQQIPDPNALYKLRIRSSNHGAWLNITNAVSGTGGAIRLTVAGHGGATNNLYWIEQLNGVTNGGALIYGNYQVTVIDSSTLELQGTTFSGAYVTGSGRAARGIAPTNTTCQFQFISCQDYAELTAEITAGRGQAVEGQAIGVRMLGTGSVTTTSSSQTVALTSIFWNESVAALSGSQTFTGASRDTGVAAAGAHRYNSFNAFAFADRAGTMRIEASNDNSTWYPASDDVTVGVNSPLRLSIPVMTRYHRVVFVNGSTANTNFKLNSSYT